LSGGRPATLPHEMMNSFLILSTHSQNSARSLWTRTIKRCIKICAAESARLSINRAPRKNISIIIIIGASACSACSIKIFLSKSTTARSLSRDSRSHRADRPTALITHIQSPSNFCHASSGERASGGGKMCLRLGIPHSRPAAGATQRAAACIGARGRSLSPLIARREPIIWLLNSIKRAPHINTPSLALMRAPVYIHMCVVRVEHSCKSVSWRGSCARKLKYETAPALFLQITGI
jgi:hypothetical protein